MTRSQAVALPDQSAQQALSRIVEAFTAIEQAETPGEAASIADQARILAAAARAADLGLEAQNSAAHLRLAAERRLGTLLEPVITNGVASIPDGISQMRATRARKLARIPIDQWDAFIGHTLDEGKELTQAAALRLAPAGERAERKSIADSYTAPPIDVQLARELGLDVSDEIAEIIVRAISDALNDMENPRHAYVWAKYHGIQDDGTIGDRWVFPGIAAMLGKSREYTESLYYRASHHVRGRIAVEALNALQRHLIAAA
jgi:hypothetical protein